MRICRILKEDVQAQGWKPEPHTVSLKDDGDWWGCVDSEGKILSVVCVSEKHGGKYFSETFTPIQYRHSGLCSALLKYLAEQVYKDDLLIAHCLRASVNCYKFAGFRLEKVREFKYGNQYFMKREANDGKTEN